MTVAEFIVALRMFDQKLTVVKNVEDDITKEIRPRNATGCQLVKVRRNPRAKSDTHDYDDDGEKMLLIS